jgi:hypothetical protein
MFIFHHIEGFVNKLLTVRFLFSHHLWHPILVKHISSFSPVPAFRRTEARSQNCSILDNLADSGPCCWGSSLLGVLTAVSAHAQPSFQPVEICRALVCKVTFKHLPQPHRKHTQSFGMRKIFENPPFVRPFLGAKAPLQIAWVSESVSESVSQSVSHKKVWE